MKRTVLSLILLFGCLTVSAQSSVQQQENKLSQVYRLMTTYYVDTLSTAKVVEDAIVKLLGELDPHSYYLSAEDMKAASEQTDGSFSGIGIEFDVLKDTLKVVNVMPNSPSESVGLQANDCIVSIDGENIVGIRRDRVPKILRGPKGTVVQLKVLRRGEPLTFRITRDDIPIYSVDASYKLDGGWGYVKVGTFADNTVREFRTALRKLGTINGLVLDLRDNGGGLMERAIEMCEMFLSRGQQVLSIEGRAVGAESYRVRSNGAYRNLPLVIIIDEGSASASEIVSGAMQDWDRGVIIGQTSYGKGLVQRRFPLSDGSSVSITIARYHTPSGRVIQRPYELGNDMNYAIDHLRRTYDAQYADSVLQNAPHFKTLRTGRTVIGSGGIVPDIVVKRDTTADFRYWNKLTAEGIVNEWANLWLGTHRSEIASKYATVDAYINGFTVSDTMIDSLEAAAKGRGIEKPNSALTSQKVFKEMLRALIARKIWDTTAYYRIINPTDETYNRMLQLITSWDSEKQLLGGS